MIRKIILFTLLTCTVLPTRANAKAYCIPAETVREIQDNLSNYNPDMQRAYEILFAQMVSSTALDMNMPIGCVTPEILSRICRQVWGSNTDTLQCRKFVGSLIPEMAPNFKPLEFSNLLAQTDFSNIDPEIFKQAFNNTLARRRDRNIASKLQDMGTVFLKQGQEKQINPFVSSAISMYESTYGTSSIARNINNIAGLVGKNGYIKFDTVQASITKQAETILKWIAEKDISTLAYSGHYCAKSVAPRWSADVTSIAKRIYKNYNAILQEQK